MAVGSWQLAVGGLVSAECWVLREERELAVGSGQLADLGVLREERELAVGCLVSDE